MGGFRRDLTDQRFGFLTVLFRIDAPGQSRWMCRCDCGVHKTIRADALVTDRTKSCNGFTHRLKVSTGIVVTGDGAPYCEIPLTHGQVAKVDPADYIDWRECNWYALWNKGTRSFYAVRTLWIPGGGRSRTIYMHRAILGIENSGRLVQGDHIGHDTLDNRRENLRSATPAENMWNSRDKSCGNATGYRWVTKLPNGRFRGAVRTSSGRRVLTPSFTTAEEAFVACCQLVKEHHGEFAYAKT